MRADLLFIVVHAVVALTGVALMAYEWEREEWRCAVEAAEDAGECDNDRPSKSDLAAEDDDERCYDDE
jgi:hypothetical protein